MQKQVDDVLQTTVLERPDTYDYGTVRQNDRLSAAGDGDIFSALSESVKGAGSAFQDTHGGRCAQPGLAVVSQPSVRADSCVVLLRKL